MATIKFVVNNYQLGAKVKSTPTHKIIKQERIDSKHIEIYYGGLTDNEIAFVERVLAKKAQYID